MAVFLLKIWQQLLNKTYSCKAPQQGRRSTWLLFHQWFWPQNSWLLKVGARNEANCSKVHLPDVHLCVCSPTQTLRWNFGIAVLFGQEITIPSSHPHVSSTAQDHSLSSCTSVDFKDQPHLSLCKAKSVSAGAELVDKAGKQIPGESNHWGHRPFLLTHRRDLLWVQREFTL